MAAAEEQALVFYKILMLCFLCFSLLGEGSYGNTL